MKLLPSLSPSLSLVAGTAAVLLAGCAMAPKPLQGEFAALSPLQSSESARAGDLVRWGGEIVQVETRPDRSCFELLSKPLRDSARPQSGDISDGRFFACRSGFYDPALFAPGRELTVTGRVEGFEERPIGEYVYRYPRVAAEVLYLWPEQVVDYRYHHYGAWPHYPGAFWGFHYRPVRVIVRPPPAPRRRDGD
jgi:outer membrane lipoprotein